MRTYECPKCGKLSYSASPLKENEPCIYCANPTVKLVDEAKTPPHNDPINHPAHYTTGKIEVIDFIDDKELTYCLGNAVKYIARAGKKDPNKTIEDLKKAAWYINHEIERMERNEQI